MKIMNANKLIPFLVCWLLIFGWQMGQAQFTRQGTAVPNNPGIPPPPADCGNVFRITDNLTGEAGAVWSNTTVDLSRSFILNASMYFGNNNGGADGLTFVLQNVGIGALGGRADGLGLLGIAPSVAVEFDDWDNNSNGVADEGAQDHMDIVYDGLLNTSGPFLGNVALPNIEDNRWHDVLIEWDVCSNTGEQCLTVTFDGGTTIQQCDDMIADRFGGNPIVTWGFTGATGGASNAQGVCIGNIVYPTLTVNPITPVCMGESATVVAQGTGRQFIWSPTPDNVTRTGMTEVATYNNVMQDFIVSVQAINAAGCDAITVDEQVTVIPLPTLNLTATKQELCEGETTIIDVTTPAPGVTELLYVDNMGVVNVVPHPFNLTHSSSTPTVQPTGTTPDGSAFYTFIGQASDTSICGASDTIIIIGSNLEVQIGHPDTICEGETINFSASAQGGFRDISNPYTFNWSENGLLLNSSNLNQLSGINPVVETNIYSYVPPVGNGFLDLEVVDRAGCVVNVTLPYVVNATPSVSIHTSEDTICGGEEVILSASPNGAVTYDWTPNSLGTTSTVTATVNLFGNNPFSVAVTDANGCQDSTTINVRGVSCCQVTQNSNDYLRLDPDNPDSRLTDYGINQYQNSRFYIINTIDEYQRLPERVYLADEVTLFVRGRGNTLDVTNSDLVFGARAGLFIEANNELIANNTVFRPCDETQTWDGVVVTGDNSVANFRECTFVNPTVGVHYANSTTGTVSSSLFLNAKHGVLCHDRLPGDISNNVFKVNDEVTNLSYSQRTSFGNGGINLGFYYNTLVTRYNIDHSGVYLLSLSGNNNTFSDDLISQNQFINAMNLGLDNPTFNGILMATSAGVNVSDNSFTNNDISVLIHRSQDISIENNHMEVTRRSTSDVSFYQILLIGEDNSTIVKGNTIVNSSDVEQLTPNLTIDVGGTITTVVGTGAIYHYGTGRARIVDNDISGFEIGIYAERATEVNLQIINNRIKANVYGIYQEACNSFIGCNEVEMDLDANVVSNAGVVGIRTDHHNNPSTATLGVAGISGNCIRNTDRAIFLENNIVPMSIKNLGWIHIQNNYLYNYIEAGLYARGYFNVQGNPNTIRRNAFISNQPNGDPLLGLGAGAFDIVTENNIPTNNSVFVIDGNYFGAKSLMTTLELGTNPVSISTLGGAQTLKPFATCGNMDATSTNPDDFNSTIEGDWMNRCDDENYGNVTPIAQRTATGTQLNATYQTTLNNLMESNQGQAENLIVAHLQDLTNMVDVEALYLTAQQFSLSTKTSNWVEYYYQERKGNYTVAQQVLNNIETETIVEAEEVSLKKAYLDLKVRNTTTLIDATLIAELKEIADRPLGVHRHTARAILHNNAKEDSYTFEYNPVKLYTKPTNTIISDVNRNTSILITPNPATREVSVNIATDKTVEWTIAELYDVHGRLLFSQPVRAYTLSFDVETLTQGVYFITLKGENGAQTTEKFIKQ